MIKTYSKGLFATMALAFMAFTASAQQRYLDEVFTNSQITVVPNVPYGYNFSQYVPATMGGPMVIPMYSDVYMPDTAIDQAASRPVVIIFHTGSFLPKGLASPLGDRKDSAVVDLAKRFARRGYVAVSASYRLGWLANSTNLDLRRGTNLLAVYSAVQDAKVCVRAVRASKLVQGDPYRIDPRGTPYIDTARVGDWNGYGGKAVIIGAHPVTGLPLVDQTQPGRNIELYKGVPHNVNMVVNLGGALGDSAWMAQGDAPVVSFHSRYDFYAPYYRGMVNVPVAGAFFPVVEVAGSHTAVKMSNTFGNNTVLAGSTMNDAYSVIARTNAYNIGNQENLFTFNMVPPVATLPFRVNSNPWDWWDPTDPLSANETNPNVKAQSLLYIDTVMAFTLPRMAKALNAVGYTISVPEAEGLKFQVLPNPTTANAQLLVYGAQIQAVEVHDLLGRAVFASEGLNASELELPSAAWAPGAYFVRIQTDRGMRTAKLIRN